MNTTKSIFAGIVLATTLIGLPQVALAQDIKSASITLELKDAPVRSSIEATFQQAGIKNYIIDNNISGFVTLKITDQPFENALKLMMRASSVPLTYTKENDVWIVKPRMVSVSAPEPSTLADPAPVGRAAISYERISLTYLDPMDLSALLGGIQNISSFTRFGNAGTTGGFGSLGNLGNSFGGQPLGGFGSIGAGGLGGFGR
jgi:hypothetical protein